MIKNLCFLVALSLATLHCISADGVAIISQPLPTQIDQVTLQADDQNILLSDFNNLEVEGAAILLELTELDNEWEWNAEWISEPNEQILLITNDHGEDIFIGSNSVTSNAENLEAVIVISGAAIDEAIAEAINEAENLIEESVQEAVENAGNIITETIQEVANEVTEAAQNSVTEAITGSITNVGDSLTGGFLNS